MSCSTEECSGAIFARNMCQKCYTRNRRTGSVQRKNAYNGGLCATPECSKPAFAKGLCAHHYEKSRHPLNHAWRLLRSRNAGAYPPEWDSFEKFLVEVGERPGPRHQLRRINPFLPFARDNFRWTPPIGLNQSGLSKEEQASYGREWTLQRKFGITGIQFSEILATQNGLCANCRQPETHRYPSGKLKDLAVDHDHVTGRVRGLLCFNCNQGIGRFKDDPAFLRAAADYLERHQSPPVISGMTLVATLPHELGSITGLRVENGAIVASSESGVDYIVPPNALPKTCTEPPKSS